MIIATIDTDTLPKEFVMAWTGIVTPSLHQISWVAPSINMLEPLKGSESGKLCVTTDEDFEAIKSTDGWHMDAVRAECFPCVPHCWTLRLVGSDPGVTKVIVMVPVSELKRVGLMD